MINKTAIKSTSIDPNFILIQDKPINYGSRMHDQIRHHLSVVRYQETRTENR